MLNFEMHATIKFNRPINSDVDYICPGGYSMTMAGKDVMFDFVEYKGNVDEDDATLLHVKQRWLDEDVLEESEYPITKSMLSKVENISEFFVFTGYKNETDLKPISVESITFVLPDDGNKEIHVKNDVLKSASVCSELG